MPVTTTESITRPRIRCSRCSSTVTVAGMPDASGSVVGACCARPSDRAMLVSMGAGPEMCIPPEPSFIACDPLSHAPGAHPHAVAIIAKVARKGHRQATPEAVAEVLAVHPELAEPFVPKGRLNAIAMGPDEPAPPGYGLPIGARRTGQTR